MSNKQWFLQKGTKNYFLSREITTIGQRRTNTIRIKSELISPKHCSIAFDENNPILYNHSKNAVKLNGKTIQFVKILRAEDTITFPNNEKLILKNTKNLLPETTIVINDESENENEIISLSDTSNKVKRNEEPKSPSLSEIKRLRTEDWISSTSQRLTPYSYHFPKETTPTKTNSLSKEGWSPISSTPSEFYYGPNNYINNEKYDNYDNEKYNNAKNEHSNRKINFTSVTLQKKFDSNKWNLKDKKIKIIKPNTKINECNTQ